MKMLNKVLKFIFDLNKTTALLEACDWDEERYDFILETLVTTFNQITTGYHEFHNTDALVSEIKNRMKDISSDREIDIIENILLEEFSEVNYQEIEYEN